MSIRKETTMMKKNISLCGRQAEYHGFSRGSLFAYFIFVALIWLISSACTPASKHQREHQRRVLKILDQSVFNKSSPPASLENGQLTSYDPMMISVAASLRSEQPSINAGEYKEVALPPAPNSPSICSGPISAFVRKTDSPYTFVILPGTHGNWRSAGGSFYNQTINSLDKNFDDPNIIAFHGYLSPDFLEGSHCNIPWDTVNIGLDFYLRTSAYLESIQADPLRTGLIGYSGGGGLTLLMLAYDSADHDFSDKKYFGLGGIAFSPTLDGRVTFNNLDTGYKVSVEKYHDNTLSSVDLKNIPFFLRAIRDFTLDWKDIVESYEKNPEDFRARAFNYFTINNLTSSMEAVGFDENNINGSLSHYNFYINTGFRQDITEELGREIGSLKTLNRLYDEKSNAVPFLDQIEAPFLIYFSKDDPVLSSYDDSGQPRVITRILNRANSNSNIIVFNPKYGAHIGVFFDPIFPELLHIFFVRDEQEPEE